MVLGSDGGDRRVAARTFWTSVPRRENRSAFSPSSWAVIGRAIFHAIERAASFRSSSRRSGGQHYPLPPLPAIGAIRIRPVGRNFLSLRAIQIV